MKRRTSLACIIVSVVSGLGAVESFAASTSYTNPILAGDLANEVDFLAGPDEKSLKKVANSEDLSGYNHATFGGYLAVRPALYVAGDGNAVFRNFRYRTLVTQ